MVQGFLDRERKVWVVDLTVFDVVCSRCGRTFWTDGKERKPYVCATCKETLIYE